MIRRLMGTAVLLGAGVAWAGGFSSDARGTSAAEFLKLPGSARAAALGGAGTTLSGDASALAGNPAGLADVERRSAVLAHAPDPVRGFHSSALYAQRRGAGAWGAGFTYVSAGRIDETEPTVGATVGTFTPSDWAGSLAYARRWGGWAFGVGGKYVRSKVIEADGTFAGDAGVLSPAFLGERVRLGASVRNLGGRIRLGTTGRPLPVEAALGAALAAGPHWRAVADLKFPRDNDPQAALGLEGDFTPAPAWRVAGRAGWNSGVNRDLGDLAGFSAGFGVARNGVGIDYAFSPLGDLGDAHRVSMTLAF